MSLYCLHVNESSATVNLLCESFESIWTVFPEIIIHYLHRYARSMDACAIFAIFPPKKANDEKKRH